MARRRAPPRVSGVALIDKPAGVTSHDVVQRIRRGLGQRQVGHTGTLDPAATGLMVLTLGRATRIGRFLEATDKVYEGTIQLGRSTTTWDAEGEVVETVPVPAVSEDDVRAVFETLTGRIEQEVPAFSALKRDGERLFARARRGEAVVGPRRPVDVRRFALRGVDGDALHFEVEVSKGTYVRSLAVDVGRRLGVPAHLSALRRLRVGPHAVGSAVAPERFEAPEPPIEPPASALSHLPAAHLGPGAVRSVAYGQPLPASMAPVGSSGLLRLLDPEGCLVAVGRLEPGGAHVVYEVVLIRPEERAGTV